MAIAELPLLETKYPYRRVWDDPNPLKQAKWNAKIGGRVRKGPLFGATIFTLTLEERATCPLTCGQMAVCYGDNMNYAKRQQVDVRFYANLARQLYDICSQYQKVLVRLHVLGDFVDLPYIFWWSEALDRHENLWIWGYTHHRPNTPEGQAIDIALNGHERCRILLSCDTESDLDQLADGGYAIVVKDWGATPPGFVRCPAELTKNTVQCGDCTLCFPGGKHDICFKEH